MRTTRLLLAASSLAILAPFAVSLLRSSVPVATAAGPVAPLSVKPAKVGLKKQIFGTVGTTSPPKNVTLTNKGGAPIALLGTALQGDFAVDLGLSTCGASLAPGAKCVLAVTFTPTALGDRFGQLTITHDALGSPQSVALKGKGVAGKLIFTPSSLKFANQPLGGSDIPRSLLVHNPNLVPVPITGIGLEGIDFGIASRTCGSSLAAGADCTIAIRFRAAAAGGRKGTLRIAALTARSPKAIRLKGKGVAICGGVKVDVLSGNANCGGCGNVCATTCALGRCQGGTLECGPTTPNVCACGADTVCTSFLTDQKNCGGCGSVCYLGQTCQDGACAGCTSAAASDQCGTLCTSFQTDPFNCGGCGARARAVSASRVGA